LLSVDILIGVADAVDEANVEASRVSVTDMPSRRPLSIYSSGLREISGDVPRVQARGMDARYPAVQPLKLALRSAGGTCECSPPVSRPVVYG
jgi:hypothetical protein